MYLPLTHVRFTTQAVELPEPLDWATSQDLLKAFNKYTEIEKQIWTDVVEEKKGEKKEEEKKGVPRVIKETYELTPRWRASSESFFQQGPKKTACIPDAKGIHTDLSEELTLVCLKDLRVQVSYCYV